MKMTCRTRPGNNTVRKKAIPSSFCWDMKKTPTVLHYIYVRILSSAFLSIPLSFPHTHSAPDRAALSSAFSPYKDFLYPSTGAEANRRLDGGKGPVGPPAPSARAPPPFSDSGSKKQNSTNLLKLLKARHQQHIFFHIHYKRELSNCEVNPLIPKGVYVGLIIFHSLKHLNYTVI